MGKGWRRKKARTWNLPLQMGEIPGFQTRSHTRGASRPIPTSQTKAWEQPEQQASLLVRARPKNSEGRLRLRVNQGLKVPLPHNTTGIRKTVGGEERVKP